MLERTEYLLNPNYLPYIQAKRLVFIKEEIPAAHCLNRMFAAKIRRAVPHHYLIHSYHPHHILPPVKKAIKKHKYFLRFDVRRFFPSINHQLLLETLPELYPLLGYHPSRRLKKLARATLPEILAFHQPHGVGLPVGSRLSYLLAGLFLLPLDLALANTKKLTFFRYVDDYLLFGRDHQTLLDLYQDTVLPRLTKLALKPSPEKLKSGRLHRDELTFLGFSFKSGYVRIEENRLKRFKKETTTITHPNHRRAALKKIIHQSNNKISGFGHYYKYAAAQTVFDQLDAHVRHRVRVFATQTNRQNRLGNLYLTNQRLEKMGLKSLGGIYRNYHQKDGAAEKKAVGKKPPRAQKKTGFTKVMTLKDIERELKAVGERLDRIEKILAEGVEK